jgi:hypothetical protein
VWGRGVYRVLVEKPDGRRPLKRPRHRWGIILKWILEKWDGVHGLDRSGSGYGQVAGCFECGNESSVSMKCGEFLEYGRTVSFSGRPLLDGVIYLVS